jgi:hypothetical protein
VCACEEAWNLSKNIKSIVFAATYKECS